MIRRFRIPKWELEQAISGSQKIKITDASVDAYHILLTVVDETGEGEALNEQDIRFKDITIVG